MEFCKRRWRTARRRTRTHSDGRALTQIIKTSTAAPTLFLRFEIVRAGDCVLMRPFDTSKPPYVAHVEKIEQDNRNTVRVNVRWFYRPEESIGGVGSFMEQRSFFYLTIIMFRVLTPLKGSVLCTLSRTIISLRM